MTKSCILRGTSTARDPEQAADELHAAIYQHDAALSFFFCSPHYALAPLAKALNRRFKDTPLIGCTTAGEITPRGYIDCSITGASLPGREFTAATLLIEDLREFQTCRAPFICEPLLQAVRGAPDAAVRQNIFGLVLIDGLSLREEVVASSLYSGLVDIPLCGGSAGDGLAFKSTHVYFGGAFHTDSAVFTLVKTDNPFTVFKTQNVASRDTKVVVTGADALMRTVTELNGLPAAAEYARLVGVAEADLGSVVYATNPILIKIGGEYHVRSISRANEDRSLTFLGAIDLGLVLTLGEGRDLVSDVKRLFEGIRREVGPPQLVIGCNCVHRYIEMQQTGCVAEIGGIFQDNNVVGFSTYGQQYNAMHINQAFTGVAVGAGEATDA
jgi:hypothetical protein